MNVIKKHKTKILIGVFVIAVLIFAFLWGGNSPSKQDTDKKEAVSDTFKVSDEIYENTEMSENGENASEEIPQTAEIKPEKEKDSPKKQENINVSEETSTEISEKKVTDEYKTEPPSENEPVPQEPESAVISDKELTCTLSVRCDTILRNISWLDDEKAELVPKDGVIFAETTVTFYEGESVFNLLCREMKKNKIHLEYVNTPLYNSAYIEGIANLYEFDCGELSGWMYKVNGWFPNYGCSRYQLKEGDKVEWVYTCDLGKDVGGDYSAKNGK